MSKTIPQTSEELFNELVQMNVNSRTETKNGLTYLSWAWAWQEFKRICPDAAYEIKKFPNENGQLRPYMDCGDDLGYICWTSITALGQTYEMWLPVMDGANKAMKKEPYTYQVKEYEWDEIKKKKVYKGMIDKTVEAATVFDINKTIMRCLVKNIAMFGLGLYIYAGEDLPAEIEELCTPEQVARMNELGVKLSGIKVQFGVNELEALTAKQAEFVIKSKEAALVKNAQKKEEAATA